MNKIIRMTGIRPDGVKIDFSEKEKTYQIKCKKGHIATYDVGDYDDFCMCGEKYECCYSISHSGIHSFNCPRRREKIIIKTLPSTAEEIAEEIIQLFQDYADKNEDENVRVAVKFIREELNIWK